MLKQTNKTIDWHILNKVPTIFGSSDLSKFLKTEYKYCLSTEFYLIILREIVIFLTDLWSNLCFVCGDEGKMFSHGYQYWLTSFREYLVILPWEKFCRGIRLTWLYSYYLDIMKICLHLKKESLTWVNIRKDEFEFWLFHQLICSRSPIISTKVRLPRGNTSANIRVVHTAPILRTWTSPHAFIFLSIFFHSTPEP